jgi:hypothetical protein
MKGIIREVQRTSVLRIQAAIELVGLKTRIDMNDDGGRCGCAIADRNFRIEHSCAWPFRESLAQPLKSNELISGCLELFLLSDK